MNDFRVVSPTVMLNDFFHDLNFELGWEQFLALPRHPAYRYEYRDGHVNLTPIPRYFQCLLSFSSPSLENGFEPEGGAVSCFFSEYELRILDESDWADLPALFSSAFQRMPPLCHLSREDRLAAAQSLLSQTRQGEDGPCVQPASCVLNDRQTGELLAASLITLIPQADPEDFTSEEWTSPAPVDAVSTGWGQPHLTWIFVDPKHQRRNLGKVLLRESISKLRRLGYSHLISTFLMGDHASTLWHWKMGFQLAGYPASPRKLSRSQ